MILCLLSLMILVSLIFIKKITITFIKENDTKLFLTLFNKNINLINFKKNKAPPKKKKNHFSVFKLIGLFFKWLRKCEIKINKIQLPQNFDTFSTNTPLKPYEIYSIVFAFVVYLKKRSKDLIITNHSFVIDSSHKNLCLDISVKIRLFHLLLFLFDLLLLLIKKR